MSAESQSRKSFAKYDYARIRKLIAEGNSYRQVRDRMGCSLAVVQRALSDEIIKKEKLISVDQYEYQRMKEALEFYANEENWTECGIAFNKCFVGEPYNHIYEQVQDFGERARKALEKEVNK